MKRILASTYFNSFFVVFVCWLRLKVEGCFHHFSHQKHGHSDDSDVNPVRNDFPRLPRDTADQTE